jgi:hypothetical protein
MVFAYKYLIWAVLLASGAAGGWVAWWHFSKSIYLRDAGAEVFGEATIKPGVLLRRQMRRLAWTAAGVVGGVIVGMMALTTLTRFQT